MTTEKQMISNQQNALSSTGAKTEDGKSIVSRNAIKHGVFAKDLIISDGDGRENEEEYNQLLNNLTESLNPQGQMEYLLVEKIAVDFWRLRRVLRFETGSIRKYLDMVIYDYYHAGNKTNAEIDGEIKQQQEYLAWNNAYIKALKKGVVKFDKPTWTGEGLESNIEDDLYMVVDTMKDDDLSEDEYADFEDGELSFEELKAILEKAGYKDKDISDNLMQGLEKQNEGYKKSIYDLEQNKIKNKITEEVNIRMRSLPSSENAEKILRYEKSIQKSIFQNLVVLKRLQSLPEMNQAGVDKPK